jgi:Concanavalin A-like lectin/glucanases superfamily
MRLVVAAVLAGGCGFSASVIGDNREPDAPKIDGAPGSARKRVITIPDAKVYADLTDFPIWFVLDDPSGLGAKATAAGDDIYFTRLDGTPLEYERVAWNKLAGHLEAWVKVDLLEAAPSQFELRFGDPGPAHAPDAAAVFGNGFVAVWHMDDPLVGNTAVRDARGAVMGTATNGPVSAPGKLGNAIDFDGSNDEVRFINPVTGSGSTTISAWVALSAPAAGYSSVMTIGSAQTNQSRFLHTKYPGLGYGFYNNDVQTKVDLHDGVFTLVHWVYDDAANQAALYRDGVQIGATETVTGTINTTGAGGHIGTAPAAWGPGGNPVNGLLDEVRIASSPRSPGWIQTEYENQRDAVAFYTLGPELPAP